MPLIVDTYNVLHVTGVLPPELAGIGVDGLVELVGGSRYRRERVELVCDGAPRPEVPPGARGHVRVLYAGAGHTADDFIAVMVRRAGHPRQITVVSSDAEVQRSARRRRCRVLPSETFLQHLADDAGAAEPRPAAAPPRPKGVDDDAQVGAWLSVFGLDADDDGDPLEALREELPDVPATPSAPEAGAAPRPDADPDGPDGPAAPGPDVFTDDVIREAESLLGIERDGRDEEPAP